jgi:hypothetical protein
VTVNFTITSLDESTIHAVVESLPASFKESAFLEETGLVTETL